MKIPIDISSSSSVVLPNAPVGLQEPTGQVDLFIDSVVLSKIACNCKIEKSSFASKFKTFGLCTFFVLFFLFFKITL